MRTTHNTHRSSSCCRPCLLLLLHEPLDKLDILRTRTPSSEPALRVPRLPFRVRDRIEPGWPFGWRVSAFGLLEEGVELQLVGIRKAAEFARGGGRRRVALVARVMRIVLRELLEAAAATSAASPSSPS